jgi:hypothetical protein
MEERRGTEEKLRGGCYRGGGAKRRWEAEAGGWSNGAVREDGDKVIRSADGEVAREWGLGHQAYLIEMGSTT